MSIVEGLAAFSSSIFFCFVLKKCQIKNDDLTSIPQQSHVSQHKFKGVYVELLLPIVELGRAETLLNNDSIITKAVQEAGESILVYIFDEAEQSVVNSADMFQYMSDVYSQLWDEMVVQKKLNLSCAVVCDAVESPFATPANLFSHRDVQAVYSSSMTPVRSKAITSIRSNAGVDGSVEFIECAKPSAAYASQAENFYVDVGLLEGKPVGFPTFTRVALGGTFDRLHNGHRKLLTLGAGVCKNEGILTVGITSDELLSKKANADIILPYCERAKTVIDFLSIIKPSLSVDIVKLDDPFGPTITDPSIEALVVSSETISGVNKINSLRSEKKFRPLSGVVVRRSNISNLSSSFLRENSL